MPDVQFLNEIPGGLRLEAQNLWSYCTMYKNQIYVKSLDKKYYFVVLLENILFFLVKKKLTR